MTSFVSQKLGLTGATGLIGSYIAPRLGLPYKALVRNPEAMRSGAEDVLGDIQNMHDVECLVEGTDTLIHLACSTNPRSSNRDITADLSQNLLSSVHLFEAFYKANPNGHIIFASTGGGMYPAQAPEICPIKETQPPAPWSSYAIHKLAAEQYLLMMTQGTQRRATVLRISNPYGTLLPSKRGQGLIGVALTLLKEGKNLNVIESPESVRDYIHMDDVTTAFKSVVASPPVGGNCALYHIGSGIGHSIDDIISGINQVTGKQLTVTVEEAAKQAQPSYNILDCTKAKQQLNWQPETSLQSGLQKMWAQFQ